MGRRYCKNCKRYVKPVPNMNWIVFLLLFIFGGGVLGILYMLYKLFRPVCPICRDRNFK